MAGFIGSRRWQLAVPDRQQLRDARCACGGYSLAGQGTGRGDRHVQAQKPRLDR